MRRSLRLIFVFLASCAIFMAKAQTDSTIQHRENIREPFPVISITPPEDTSLIVIADISLHGNKKTQPFIIERELPFKQGDYLSAEELEKKLVLANERVMNTALFTQVHVYIESRHDDLVFINVDVKERWYLFPLPYFKLVDRNFNQWLVEQKASFSRVDYGIKFDQKNFSGRNDNLSVYLIAGYSRQIWLKYEQPYANRNLDAGYRIAFNFSRQRELNYATSESKQSFYKQDQFAIQNITGEVGYLYRPAIKTRHVVKLGYTSTSIDDTIRTLNPNYFGDSLTRVSYPKLSYTIEYADADYNAYPTRGIIADASIIRKGINKQMNLTQFEYHLNYAIPIKERSSILLQSAGVLKLPFDQPYINRLMFGYGDAYLRGLEYYVIDGVAGTMGRATFRHEFYSVTLKTPPNYKRQVVIPFRFFIKGGGDVGYAYLKNPGNSLLNNKLLYTQTLGLDVLIPSYDVVFKIEYSFNQLGGSGLFFHVKSDF